MSATPLFIASSTRSTGPLPWEVDGAVGPGDQDEKELVRLLLQDLCRGNLNIAILHFLMLRRTGAPVPALLQCSCEELVRACPPRRRERIMEQVDAWGEMVGLGASVSAHGA